MAASRSRSRGWSSISAAGCEIADVFLKSNWEWLQGAREQAALALEYCRTQKAPKFQKHKFQRLLLQGQNEFEELLASNDISAEQLLDFAGLFLCLLMHGVDVLSFFVLALS